MRTANANLAPLWLRVAAPTAVVAIALVAHAGTWHGGFVFDDMSSIRDNPTIQAGDWWKATFEHPSPVGNRLLTCMSLVLDRALFGPTALGHRIGNLVLHAATCLLLYALVRAVLRGGRWCERWRPAEAIAIATAAGALLAAHPLTVDAVAYPTQRSTLLMAVCWLAALLATVAAEHSAARGANWRHVAIGCLVLGMASKEEMAAAPLLLPLFCRAFLVADWRSLRPRLPFFFTAAAASWLALLLLVLFGPPNPTVGYATNPPATAIEWLYTQAGIVCHYLLQCVWPMALRGCYDWPIVRDFGAAVAPGLVVLTLLGLCAWAMVRRPQWAFFGAWVFLCLAPTSTILPIVTELVAERRMYVPLFAIVVPAAIGLFALGKRVGLPWLGWALLASLLAAAVPLTRARVAVYRDEETFWQDAFTWQDPAHRTFQASVLFDNRGRLLRRRGDIQGARAAFWRGTECEAAPFTLHLHLATTMLELGDEAQALPILQRLGKDKPPLGDKLDHEATIALQAWYRLPPAQRDRTAQQPLADAELLARTATGLAPGRAQFANTLANLQAALGKWPAAETSYRRALALDPDGSTLYVNLADLLWRTGRAAEARALAQQALAQRPQDADLRVQLGQAGLGYGDLDLASTMVGAALQLRPGDPRALALQQQIAARRPR